MILSGKKHIVLSSNYAWTVYNFRLSLIRFLQEQGYKVSVVCQADGYESYFTESNINFHPLQQIERKGSNPLKDIALQQEFKQIYKAIQPDLIFHYTIKPNVYGNLAAQSLNIPSIVFVTGWGHIFSKEGPVNMIAKRLCRYSFKRAEQVWFLNDNDYNDALNSKICSREQSRILPGEGVDTHTLIPSPIAVENRKFHFLFLGRLLKDKGVEEFAKAIQIVKQKFPDVSCALLGFLDVQSPGAITKEQVKQWENEKLLTYLGTSDNVQEILNDVQCVVLPSYYREGVPRSLMEAASMEIPLITTDHIGCKETVDHNENGYLIPIRDEMALADAMMKMISLSLDDKIAMGKKGRKKMLAQFDSKIIFDIYKETINKIIE